MNRKKRKDVSLGLADVWLLFVFSYQSLHFTKRKLNISVVHLHLIQRILYQKTMIVSLSVQVVAPVKVWKFENNLKLRLEGKNGKEFIRLK